MNTFYITKYALTSGIFSIETDDSDDGMIRDTRNTYLNYFHGEGEEWHRTVEGAISKASQMKADRIASLKKSLAKTEKTTFSAKNIRAA